MNLSLNNISSDFEIENSVSVLNLDCMATDCKKRLLKEFQSKIKRVPQLDSISQKIFNIH
jgi:hypothetical protein